MCYVNDQMCCWCRDLRWLTRLLDLLVQPQIGCCRLDSITDDHSLATILEMEDFPQFIILQNILNSPLEHGMLHFIIVNRKCGFRGFKTVKQELEEALRERQPLQTQYQLKIFLLLSQIRIRDTVTG